MHRPHAHAPDCPADCTREEDVTGSTPTGFHRLVKIKKARGKLRQGESLTYWALWHFWQAAGKGAGQVLGLLGLLAVAILAKRCGVTLPEAAP